MSLFPDSPPMVVATSKGTDALIAAAEGLEDTSVGDFSERLVRRFLTLCENPRTRAGMLRLIRGSVGSARSGRAFYRVVNASVLNPVAHASGVKASAMRMELVSGQLVGLAMLRYVVCLEPVASASVDELVRVYAPAIRALLSGR